MTHERNAGRRSTSTDESATARHAEFVAIQRRVADVAPDERSRRHRRARARWARHLVVTVVVLTAATGAWATVADTGGVRTDVVRWIGDSANGQHGQHARR